MGVSNIDLIELGSATASDVYDNLKSNHMMKIFVCKAKPVNINHEEVKSIFWSNPINILSDMDINPNKYAGGFRSSIKIILKYLEK